MGRTVLLSGRPGVGKTTLITKWVATMPGRCGGFYTEEIRTRGRRAGFEIVTLEGQHAVLAYVGVAGLPRVGKYGVYVENVDTVAAPAIHRAVAGSDYVVIDEIGKMELLSNAFREAVLFAVRSSKSVLGTVMQGSHPWADALRSMSGVTTISVTPANREHLVDQIAQAFAS